MSEIVDFLLARYAEDEKIAAALPDDSALCLTVSSATLSPNNARAVFFLRGRALADIEAKRRIVEPLGHGHHAHPDEDHVPAGDDALYWLALPYADHPDYRPEWRP